MSLRTDIAAIAAEAVSSSVSLSVAVTDPASDRSVEWRAADVTPVASAAKVLLLATVARLVSAGALDPDETVTVAQDDHCGGTGLLRSLAASCDWTVGDLALLVAAVSDNVATNALLRRVDRSAVDATAETLGLGDLQIHDRVRDARGPADPPTFASGSARDLCRLMQLASTGRLVDPAASTLLLTWLNANEDHGLVCAPLRHDPYDPEAEPLRVWNKTGRDVGVRADVGAIAGRHRLAYAAVATCRPSAEWDAVRTLRSVGDALGRYAEGGSGFD